MEYIELKEKFERKKQIAHYVCENGNELAIPVRVDRNGDAILSDEVKTELDRRCNPTQETEIPETLSLWELVT